MPFSLKEKPQDPCDPIRGRNTHIGLVVVPQEVQSLIQFLWVKLMIQALHFSSYGLPGSLGNIRLSRPSDSLVAYSLELELLNFQVPFGTRDRSIRVYHFSIGDFSLPKCFQGIV